jgi:hypothetical protein
MRRNPFPGRHDFSPRKQSLRLIKRYEFQNRHFALIVLSANRDCNPRRSDCEIVTRIFQSKKERAEALIPRG